MKKEKKEEKTPSKSKADFERQTRVLLEQIQSEVRTVAEQYGSVAESLDKMSTDLKGHESSLFKLEMELQIVRSKVGTVDTKADRIERELNAVKTAVMENSHLLGRIEEKLDTALADHEKRLQKLEAV